MVTVPSSSSEANAGEVHDRPLDEEGRSSSVPINPNVAMAHTNPARWPFAAYRMLLVVDAIYSLLLVTPILPRKSQRENGPSHQSHHAGHYTIHTSLWDVALLAVLRIASAVIALAVAYYRRDLDGGDEDHENNGRDYNHEDHDEDGRHQRQDRIETMRPGRKHGYHDRHRGYPEELYHPNGDRKSKSELEAEALAEPLWSMLQRYLIRLPVLCEIQVFLDALWMAVKCLARLNVEIGVYDEARPSHPLFWMALAASATLALLESVHLDGTELLAWELGRCRRRQAIRQRQVMEEPLATATNSSLVTTSPELGESLTQPLLSSENSVDVRIGVGGAPTINETLDNRKGRDDENHTDDTEQLGRTADGSTLGSRHDHWRSVSDIGADAQYSATWGDLVTVIAPDRYLILLASVFLFGSALTNIYIPKLTGELLDKLVAHSSDHFKNVTASGGDVSPIFVGKSVSNIPGFMAQIQLLVAFSIMSGVFGGIRGAIFTMVGARVNCRLRIRLMDSLLSQEIGFFDSTRTGDITSRLSSDTTIVGNTIANNVNVFLQSVVRAIGVLSFMFVISWQLSLLAFFTIPAISVLSKWYARYVRRLTKLQQKKLADGNTVSEASIGSMATVRSFRAELVELAEFEKCMQSYLTLNARAALATLGYGTFVDTLPQVVKAIVLFYGGLLVLSSGPHHITGGQLISFILYLNSLSEAFNSFGGIYGSLVRALGAADKVFELMHRQPRLTIPAHVDQPRMEQAHAKKNQLLLGVDSTKVVEQGARGLYPESCLGEITFNNVQFRYPARPQHVVLDGLNVRIPAGSVVALVGVSGSGKSSMVKLIQHLYEPAAGSVCIDGIPVQEISPDWLCRHVSVVSQEPTLFARSVKRNIMYGLEGSDNEPTQDEIEEAAKLANAAVFIEGLPQGYDTEVGERGIQLSGGQKQRVAIARALVRRPRVLLLDEATSALDSESEYVVQKAIDDMISGQRSLDGDPTRSMTVIIVAHRLSTIRNADCIYVIQNGQVVERGTHEELVAKDQGVYNGLISRQLGWSEPL